jgi:membrane-associated phospholipid phosphatase
MQKLPALALSALLALMVALVATLLAADWLWNLSGVHILQSLGRWALLPMHVFTFLGDEQFYLAAIPLVYWCVHKDLGAGLGALLVLSTFGNGVIKSFLKHARPFWQLPALQLADASSFSTPSAHAQNSTVLFGYLAWFQQAVRRRSVRWTIGVVLLVLCVMLSRVYLAVHFPGDILWGAAVGLALLALYAHLKPRLLPWLRKLSLGRHLALAALTAALMFAAGALLLAVPFGAGPTFVAYYAEAWRTTLDESATTAGLALGYWIGVVLETRCVRFTVAGPLWQRALRYIVGVAVLLVIWLGLRVVFPQEPPALALALRTLRYALAMLWAIAGWPALFVSVGLGARAATPAPLLTVRDGVQRPTAL